MTRGILWFNGIAESGILPGNTIIEAVNPFATEDLVTLYLENEFEPAWLIEDALEATKYDHEIVILCLSMGFQLAYDMVATMRQNGDRRRVRLVACDALTSVKDVKNPLIAAGKIVPGSLPATLSLPWLSRMLWSRPKNHPVLPPPLDEELNQHYTRTEQFLFGKFLLQARYIARHEPLRPEVFDGVCAVSIRSEKDGLLRVSESEERLRELFGENLETFRVYGGSLNDHATILENQDGWRDRILDAFHIMDVQRLR